MTDVSTEPVVPEQVPASAPEPQVETPAEEDAPAEEYDAPPVEDPAPEVVPAASETPDPADSTPAAPSDVLIQTTFHDTREIQAAEAAGIPTPAGQPLSSAAQETLRGLRDGVTEIRNWCDYIDRVLAKMPPTA